MKRDRRAELVTSSDMAAHIAYGSPAHLVNFARVTQGNRATPLAKEFEYPPTGWISQCPEKWCDVCYDHELIIPQHIEIFGYVVMKVFLNILIGSTNSPNQDLFAGTTVWLRDSA